MQNMVFLEVVKENKERNPLIKEHQQRYYWVRLLLLLLVTMICRRMSFRHVGQLPLVVKDTP
jgi:hypothetical protein